LVKNLIGKRPLRRICLRWKNQIKLNVEELGGGSDWKEKSSEGDGWKLGCLTG